MSFGTGDDMTRKKQLQLVERYTNYAMQIEHDRAELESDARTLPIQAEMTKAFQQLRELSLMLGRGILIRGEG